MAMQDFDGWMISVDDHVIEPPHVWERRLPAKLRDRGPRVITEGADQYWLYDGKRINVNSLVTAAGLDESMMTVIPTTYIDMPEHCYDPKARVRAMDEDGVLMEACYPNLPRFCGQEFMEGPDKQLGLLCITAYNDFIIDEWAGTAPERFLPAIIIPLWDPVLAAAEMERCADKGAKMVMFSELPHELGLPTVHDVRRYWDPVFRTAVDTNMVISVHLGSSSKMPTTSPDAPSTISNVLTGWRAANTLLDWIFSDVFERFPALRLTLSEGGIAWLPQCLGRSDYALHHWAWTERYIYHKDMTITDLGPDHRVWRHGDRTPTDVFRTNIRGCSIPEQDGPHFEELVRWIGVEQVLLETDFPHGDSSWPRTQQVLTNALGKFSATESFALRIGNAMAWYSLTSDDVVIPKVMVTT